MFYNQYNRVSVCTIDLTPVSIRELPAGHLLGEIFRNWKSQYLLIGPNTYHTVRFHTMGDSEWGVGENKWGRLYKCLYGGGIHRGLHGCGFLGAGRSFADTDNLKTQYKGPVRNRTYCIFVLYNTKSAPLILLGSNNPYGWVSQVAIAQLLKPKLNLMKTVINAARVDATADNYRVDALALSADMPAPWKPVKKNTVSEFVGEKTADLRKIHPNFTNLRARAAHVYLQNLTTEQVQESHVSRETWLFHQRQTWRGLTKPYSLKTLSKFGKHLNFTGKHRGMFFYIAKIGTFMSLNRHRSKSKKKKKPQGKLWRLLPKEIQAYNYRSKKSREYDSREPMFNKPQLNFTFFFEKFIRSNQPTLAFFPIKKRSYKKKKKIFIMNHALKITKPQNRIGKLFSIIKHTYFRLKRRHKSGDYKRRTARFVHNEVFTQPNNRINRHKQTVHEDFGKEVISNMLLHRRLG